jgi:hypothetical protein
MTKSELGVGDEVEVRSAAEILATLDESGSMAGLPFMPEMAQYCGRRFVVSRRAERICDTISYFGSMRLPEAVILEDLRCDGAGHEGCEAECRLFWKEAWLRKVAPGEARREPGDAAELTKRAGAGTMAPPGGTDGAVHRCQATELVRASEKLRLVDPRPYLRILRGGEVPLGRFVRVMGRALLLESLRKLGRMPEIHLAGPAGGPSPTPPLDLQPGDWVQVRSREEIQATLTEKGRNRGLWFDREMLPYCGKTFRVRRRVTRIVDERNGRMLSLKSDCIMLDGAVCSGENSLGRWFCPRGIYPYWRESWLKKVEPPPGPARGAATSG